MRLLRALAALAATAALLTPSYAPALGDDGVPRGLSRDRLFGTTLREAKWSSTTISVCWENRDKASAAQEALVRSAVASTWEASSSVRFVGWGDCASTDAPGVHILIDESEQPYTKAVGRYLDRRPNGMHFNFEVTNWRAECKSDPNGCIRAAAVHEFGHALGFTHEQIKEGVRAECSSEPRDIIGDYLVTKYDLSSVMALCNPEWNGNGKLSRYDTEAVRKFYS